MRAASLCQNTCHEWTTFATYPYQKISARAVMVKYCLSAKSLLKGLSIPARFIEKRFLAKKYFCRCCDKFTVAPIPKSAIPGSSYGSPSVLTDMIVNKYQFALSFYRLTQMYDRAGMPINRTTMAKLMIGVADRLTPLYERFRESLLGQDIIHADEITLQVLKEPGRSPQAQSYMWQLCSGTHSAQQIAMFEYTHRRILG